MLNPYHIDLSPEDEELLALALAETAAYLREHPAPHAPYADPPPSPAVVAAQERLGAQLAAQELERLRRSRLESHGRCD